MECKDFRAMWQSLCDEDLSAEMRRRALAHRDECPSCHRWDAAMRSLEHTLDVMGEEVPETPPYLLTRVMAHINDIEQPRRAGWFAAWVARIALPRMATASLVALAFLAGFGARDMAKYVSPAASGGELAAANRKIVIEYKGIPDQEVGLVGDFNEWGKKNVPIAAKQVEGKWVFEVQLSPGRYEYAFVVNGKKWLPDPQAAGIIPDGFGGLNSVMYVRAEGDETL